MIKRLVWWTSGALMGASGSMWLQRKVRRTVQERIAPSAIAQGITGRARELGGGVRSAVDEGRAAMRTREAELRDELGARRVRRGA